MMEARVEQLTSNSHVAASREGFDGFVGIEDDDDFGQVW